MHDEALRYLGRRAACRRDDCADAGGAALSHLEGRAAHPRHGRQKGLTLPVIFLVQKGHFQNGVLVEFAGR